MNCLIRAALVVMLLHLLACFLSWALISPASQQLPPPSGLQKKWKTSSGLTKTPPATALRAISGVAKRAKQNKTGILLIPGSDLRRGENSETAAAIMRGRSDGTCEPPAYFMLWGLHSR